MLAINSTSLCKVLIMFKHDTRIFHPWQLVVMGLCFAMLLGLVGSYDYDEALDSQALYCENVASGVWPDYKEIMIGCASLLGDDQ